MSEKQKRLVLIEKEEKMDTRIQGNFKWRLQLDLQVERVWTFEVH